MRSSFKKLVLALCSGVVLIAALGRSADSSGALLHASQPTAVATAQTAPPPVAGNGQEVSIERFMTNLAKTTGIYGFIFNKERVKFRGTDVWVYGWHKLVMLIIGGVLLYLGASKNFEPLLLVPIGFGTILVNIPFAGMGDEGGFLKVIFDFGINNEFFPLVIFMGIGALTDFGPLIANPRTALLGAAAQFGVFGTLLGAVALNIVPGIAYTLKEACAISIIGGADGPTTIYLAAKLAPDLMGSVAVAAYSYMALVPLIQPPIMRALTTPEERSIRMKQLRPVSKIEKIIFPMMLLGLTILLLPTAAPLIGAIVFGNFVREIGVVERLNKTLQNELLNITTIFLGLGVGTQMVAYKFIQPATLGIVILGLIAFCFGTASGVVFAKIMNRFVKDKVNPLIGSAGVSAVPMAARVSNKLGLEADSSNFLIMHAMGPNVAGVIGTAVAAGVMIAIFGN
jgi:sodium ion-translocating decarboxylase beta subunit